jgi:hypothetical protein
MPLMGWGVEWTRLPTFCFRVVGFGCTDVDKDLLILLGNRALSLEEHNEDTYVHTSCSNILPSLLCGLLTEQSALCKTLSECLPLYASATGNRSTRNAPGRRLWSSSRTRFCTLSPHLANTNLGTVTPYRPVVRRLF